MSDIPLELRTKIVALQPWARQAHMTIWAHRNQRVMGHDPAIKSTNPRRFVPISSQHSIVPENGDSGLAKKLLLWMCVIICLGFCVGVRSMSNASVTCRNVCWGHLGIGCDMSYMLRKGDKALAHLTRIKLPPLQHRNNMCICFTCTFKLAHKSLVIHCKKMKHHKQSIWIYWELSLGFRILLVYLFQCQRWIWLNQVSKCPNPDLPNEVWQLKWKLSTNTS